MVRLNLLPPEERTKKQTIKENRYALFLSIIIMMILAGFTFYLFIVKANAGSQISEIENDIKQQIKDNNEYKEIENTVAILNKNMDLLESLKKSGITWSDILNDIRNRIPQEARLSEILVTVEGENTKTQGATIINIKGYSSVLLTVARFKESLADSPYYSYVDFESAIKGGQTGLDEYEFILKIKIKQVSSSGK
jgi:Tfp pilus assembly protein PilN